MRLAVLGAGAWGTALAIAWGQHHDVALWSREADLAAAIAQSRCNERYLAGPILPPRVTVTADWPSAVAGAEWVVIATPLAGLAEQVAALARHYPTTPFLWACKGILPETQELAHEIAERVWCETTDHPMPAHGVLSGPSFALEVAQGLPTAIVVAARERSWAKAAVTALHQPRFRLYAHDDVTGVEVGGAVKNIIAIAAGVAEGLGFGLNTRAALITRGLAEMTRLAQALGARRETLMGLAGMGDLILTCTGGLSRNRKLGMLLANGQPLDCALATLGHVAEGVPTTAACVALAKSLGIEMPIAGAVHALLFDPAARPEAIVEQLLARDPKFEFC